MSRDAIHLRAGKGHRRDRGEREEGGGPVHGGYFDGVVLDVPEPVLPLGVLLAEPDMPVPEVPEVPEGVLLMLDDVSDGEPAVPLTVPEAERLVEPVVLLAVVLGEVVDAVVSVVVVELGVDGVVAVMVPGVVVVDVVVVLRSQPVAATEASASAATRGSSFFMASPDQSARGRGSSARGRYIEPNPRTMRANAFSLWDDANCAARNCRRDENLRGGLQP